MELILHSYQGREIAFDPSVRMWNLNAMYEAACAPKNKDPRQWMRGTQAGELIAALEARETVGNSHSISVLIETREGRNGGTWAHWQIAAAYAHYLNPEFYLQWNEWALAYSRQAQRALLDQRSPYTHFVRAIQELGKNQDERAAALGITTRTLSRYCNGEVPSTLFLVSHPELYTALIADSRQLPAEDAAPLLAKLQELIRFVDYVKN
jgi:hypothetical protein